MRTRIPFNLVGRQIYLRPYNTRLEKEVLLLQQLSDDNLEYCINETIRVFGFESDNTIKIEDLSYKEKLLILYLYRGISVGDECSLNIPCPSCNGVSSNNILFDFYDKTKQIESGIRLLEKELTTENLRDFLTDEYAQQIKSQEGVEDIEDIDLDKYEELYEKIKDANLIFNFVKDVRCSLCSEIMRLNCGSPKFALEQLSEDNLILIYKSITVLVHLGYTKNDIDELIPFERTILTDQMINYLEEAAQNAQGGLEQLNNGYM